MCSFVYTSMDWPIIVLLIRLIPLLRQSANGTSSWSLDLSDVSGEDQPTCSNTSIPSRKYQRKLQHLLNQNMEEPNFCNAVESFKRTLKMDTERRYRQLGCRNVKAIHDFRKTIRLNPNLPIAFYEYFCDLLLEDGKCNEARLVLKKVTEEGVPENDKSRLEALLNKVEEAKKHVPVRPQVEAAKYNFLELFEKPIPIPAHPIEFTLGEEILASSREGRSGIPSHNKQGVHQSGNTQNNDKESNVEDSFKNLSRIVSSMRNEEGTIDPQPHEQNTTGPINLSSSDDSLEDTIITHQKKMKRHARTNKISKRRSPNLASQGRMSDNISLALKDHHPIQDPSTSRKRINFRMNENPNKKYTSHQLLVNSNVNQSEKSNNAENISSPRQSAPITPSTVPGNFRLHDREWIAETWMRELKNISTVAEIICVKKAIYEILFEAQLGFLDRNFINSFQSTTPTKNINTIGVPIESHTQSEDLELTKQMWVRELRNIADPTQMLFAKKAVSDVFFEAQMGNLHKTSILINRTPMENDSKKKKKET